jgi:peptidoglycan-associated lipoprotein
MRALVMAALIPLLAACSAAMPSAAPADYGVTDLSGRWTGSWDGTGIFNSDRDGDARVDLVHASGGGFGRLMLDSATAAESVPEEVRRQGLSGIRVVAQISGSRVTLRHAAGANFFTADLTVIGDRMVGDVRGDTPVRLVLTRAQPKPAPILPAPPPPQAQAPVEVAAAPLVDEPEAVEEMTEFVAAEPPVQVAMAPAEPEPQELPAARPAAEEFVTVTGLPPVHFDFDKAALRDDATEVLAEHAVWLLEHDDAQLIIEGHCDEVGTPEYNVVLGEKRARTAMQYLEAFGIEPDRVTTVSFGKERPTCTDATEECRSQNRRAEFRVKPR